MNQWLLRPTDFQGGASGKFRDMKCRQSHVKARDSDKQSSLQGGLGFLVPYLEVQGTSSLLFQLGA